MESLRILTSNNPEKTYQVISSGLRTFNISFLGQYQSEPIAIDVLNDKGEVLGGAFGSVQLEWLFIEILWLPENMRHRGIGTTLLQFLEDSALRLGAKQATLDTMGFQAENFYKKNGYSEFGRIPNFASGYDRIYMSKNLLRNGVPSL